MSTSVLPCEKTHILVAQPSSAGFNCQAGVSLPGFVVIDPRLLAGPLFPGRHGTGL